MPQLPPLTPEQRAAALEKSRASRKATSAALDRLRDGSVTLADVLGDDGSPLAGAPVLRVLRALPRVGDVTARRAMEDIGIPEKRRVRGLGARQRAALAERFAPVSA